MLFNGGVDLFTRRQVDDLGFQRIGIHADPFGLGTGGASFYDRFDLFGDFVCDLRFRQFQTIRKVPCAKLHY